MKKSIFKASFYESRRLRHDGFIDYMVKDTNSRKIYTKPFSIARKLFSFFGILFLFGLSAITDSNIVDPQNDTTVKTWGINFLPYWLFFLCGFLWYAISKVNCRKQYTAKVPYVSILNGNLYIIWMILFVNLFFISAFGRTLTIPGLLVIYSLIGIIDGIIIRKRISSIRTRLYEEPTDNSFQSKQIQLVTGFAGGIVAIWMVLKFLFPQVGEVKADFLGIISFIGMIFFVNLIALGMLVVMLLPYSLYGYYRNKYSEEYREFEGKSLEEWYGKKYLKKHKDLLNNE
ncbi:hypothetical protein [Streptococcus parasanguinis]|uniref:hypothetical protein n=1 Tax=Streptococcus parasanguinis TaxID=1318 RepID=UPI0034A351DD